MDKYFKIINQKKAELKILENSLNLLNNEYSDNNSCIEEVETEIEIINKEIVKLNEDIEEIKKVLKIFHLILV